ncbi:MAG: FAD:protein FMN transferase [Eubacterium sp.]|nr:FAD:protein FMN transferase [Eubacterium sp.]
MKKYRSYIYGLVIMLLVSILLVVSVAYYKGKNKTYGKQEGYTVNGNYNSPEKSYNAYSFSMGTSVSVTFYDAYMGINGNPVSKFEELSNDLFSLIRYLDIDIISWRNTASMLYKYNNVHVTEELNELKAVIDEDSDHTDLERKNAETRREELNKRAEILKRILYVSSCICRDSEGALDITIRPIAELWGIESFTGDPEYFTAPSEDALQDAASSIGYEKLELYDIPYEMKKLLSDYDGEKTSDDTESLKEIYLNGVMVDLGAVGKGYALDYIYDNFLNKYLEKNAEHPEKDFNKRGIILAAGGSIMAAGSRPDGSGFRIGVRDPKGSMKDMVGYIKLTPGCRKVCVSTSGNYEKYVEKDGVRYHHIIDPSTLHPADSGLVSVTVVCDDTCILPEYAGLISDGLSTACFVLGQEKAEELLKKYKAEAVFIDTNGKITVTDGLKDSFVKE